MSTSSVVYAQPWSIIAAPPMRTYSRLPAASASTTTSIGTSVDVRQTGPIGSGFTHLRFCKSAIARFARSRRSSGDSCIRRKVTDTSTPARTARETARSGSSTSARILAARFAESSIFEFFGEAVLLSATYGFRAPLSSFGRAGAVSGVPFGKRASYIVGIGL